MSQHHVMNIERAWARDARPLTTEEAETYWHTS